MQPSQNLRRRFYGTLKQDSIQAYCKNLKSCLPLRSEQGDKLTFCLGLPKLCTKMFKSRFLLFQKMHQKSTVFISKSRIASIESVAHFFFSGINIIPFKNSKHRKRNPFSFPGNKQSSFLCYLLERIISGTERMHTNVYQIPYISYQTLTFINIFSLAIYLTKPNIQIALDLKSLTSKC